MYMLDTG